MGIVGFHPGTRIRAQFVPIQAWLLQGDVVPKDQIVAKSDYYDLQHALEEDYSVLLVLLESWSLKRR
jgi:hypothetical protein